MTSCSPKSISSEEVYMMTVVTICYPSLCFLVEMAGEAGSGKWFRLSWHWLGIGLAFRVLPELPVSTKVSQLPNSKAAVELCSVLLP